MEITKYAGGYYGIKNANKGAWIYAGEPNYDDERKRVLCWNGAGDPTTDESMRWNIQKIRQGYGIQSVRFGTWMFAGEPKLEEQKRFVLL